MPFRVDLFVWDNVPLSSRRQIEAEYHTLVSREERPVADGWRATTLGEVIDLRRGFDFPIIQRSLGEYPVVASTGPVGTHHRAMVRGPGVVVGCSESPGCVQFIKSDFWPLNSTLWVKDFHANVPRFCYFLLESLDLKQYNAGGGVPKLDRNHIHRLPVRVPGDSKQRAIADILGTLDDKIELKRRMNETLEATERALFKSWFVDFDPVRAKMECRDTGLPDDVADLFPDRFVDSEMGKIPDGWEVSEIGKEVNVFGGSTPCTKEPSYWHQGQHYWTTPKDRSQLWSSVLLDTSRKITDAGLQKISAGTVPVGTVLLTSRAPIGWMAITEVPTAVNHGFIAMRCEQRLPNLYVLYWCYQNFDHIRDIAGGSKCAEIGRKAFRLISVLVPSQAILGVYERLGRPLYDRLVVNMKEAVTLVALRNTLLPKLISGKVRVPDAERALESVT